MKIHNLLNATFSSIKSINHLQSKLMMNTLTMQNRVLFGFGSRKDSNADHTAIFGALKGKSLIKIWSLEGIIEKSLSKSKGISNFKSVTEIISYINEELRKQNQNCNRQFNIVINKYFSSIQNLNPSLQQPKVPQSYSEKEISEKDFIKNLIEIINSSQQWGFLPHYQNVINRQKSSNNKQLKLLIGDYNNAIIEHFPRNSYVTLEQLCAMYPQKVPLSYRKRQVIENIRQGVSKRLSEGNVNKVSLNEEPRFNEIVIINDRIKMWDEAYQVMLDELPIKITVPFHAIQPSQRFHRLNIHNFISGFKQCHRIIHPEIPLEIQQQTIQQFITEYLNNQPKDPSSKSSKLQVQIMDQSLFSQSGKRFEILY